MPTTARTRPSSTTRRSRIRSAAFGDILFSPLARWDASGTSASPTTATTAAPTPRSSRSTRCSSGRSSLPYPSEGALLVSAYVVSLACFAGALWLLHRLVELELGRPVAGATVWLVALFPAAVFFGAPYSESLFLLVSVGAFYAARTGRWAWAGALAAAAAATRSAGIVLLVPLFILWLDSQPAAAAASLAWLGLAPLGLAAYALHLGLAHGDALAFVDAQEVWYRDFAGPFVGVVGRHGRGLGRRPPARERRRARPSTSSPPAGDPFSVRRHQPAAVRVPRLRSGRAWSARSGACRSRTGRTRSPRSRCRCPIPVDPQPLMSLPRFVAVLFPLFIWLAVVARGARWTTPVTSAFAVGLGLFTAQFAAWEWIS